MGFDKESLYVDSYSYPTKEFDHWCLNETFIQWYYENRTTCIHLVFDIVHSTIQQINTKINILNIFTRVFELYIYIYIYSQHIKRTGFMKHT